MIASVLSLAPAFGAALSSPFARRSVPSSNAAVAARPLSYAIVPESAFEALDDDSQCWERNKPFSLPHQFHTHDWWRTMRSMPRSQVLRSIWQPVVLSSALGLIAAVLYRLCPQLPRLSFAPHSLIGSALSLLLVFRTNAAHARFWEGRQRWQQLADHVRSLSRYIMLFEEALGRERRCRVARLLCAFPIVLKQHLRGTTALPHVRPLLTKAEVLSLRAAHNQPLHIVNLLGIHLAAVPEQADVGFTSRERLFLLNLVQSLSDCIGACERIVLTPVPLHYAKHTSRLATIFVATLPLVLAPELSFALPLVMAFVSWTFFGIQEIGLQIEDPFRSVLKLDRICQSIQRDVQQTLEASLLKEEASAPPSAGTPWDVQDAVDVSQAADDIRIEKFERDSKVSGTSQDSADDHEVHQGGRSNSSVELKELDENDGDIAAASETASRMAC